MALPGLRRLLKKSRPARTNAHRGRFRPKVEPLAGRVMPVVTAFFSPGTHALTVFGDALANPIQFGRDAAGNILVNGGSVTVHGGTPTVTNTRLMSAFGRGGNDTIALDEANGALPAAQLFGGDGDDTLTGGAGADLLFGEAGNDAL